MVTLYSPDLDIKKIAESGQCFRMEETGAGRYTLTALGRVLRIDAVAGGCALPVSYTHLTLPTILLV